MADIDCFKGQIKETFSPSIFEPGDAKEALEFIKGAPGYEATPLLMAEAKNTSGILIKDESKRFSLKAFKALGGLYAVGRILKEKLGMGRGSSIEEVKKALANSGISRPIFATASDGNHGAGLAFASSVFGCPSKVFLPKAASEARLENIRRFSMASAFRTGFGYDGTVGYAARLAKENGWELVQDTAWEGYEAVPKLISIGYGAMAEEIASQLKGMDLCPTHVFLQAGVGSFASAMIESLSIALEYRPIFIIAEPKNSDCFFRSAQAGSLRKALLDGQTIMAGLDCQTPSFLAWPVLRDYAGYFLRCDDRVSVYAMRDLAQNGVISGESGAIGYGAYKMVSELDEYANLRKELGVGPNSLALAISTEGDTDHQSWEKIAGGCFKRP